MTTVLFDDKCELLWNGKAAENVRLADKEYYVRGSTALLDAVREAGNIGICEDNAYDFEATGEGIREMYCRVCETVTEKRHKA